MLELNKKEQHDVVLYIQKNYGSNNDTWKPCSELKKDILRWAVINENVAIVSSILKLSVNLHEISDIVLHALMSKDEKILELIMGHHSSCHGMSPVEAFIIALPPLLTSPFIAFKAINGRQDAYMYVNRAIKYSLIDKYEIISLMLLCIDNDNPMMEPGELVLASHQIQRSLSLIFKEDTDMNLDNGPNDMFDYICGVERIKNVISMAENINTDGANRTVINNSWKIMLSAILAISSNLSVFNAHIIKFRHNVATLDGSDRTNQTVKTLYANSSMAGININDGKIDYPDFIKDMIYQMGGSWSS